MYIVDGVAYAQNFNNKELRVVDFKIVSELCMLVTFSNGEKRVFDAQYLTKYQVYNRLKDFNIFKNAYIENGIIVWDKGAIDISTDNVYNNSYEYEQDISYAG